MARTSELNGKQRYILRRTILNHYGWKSYSKERGINSNYLVSTTSILNVCHDLGIDVTFIGELDKDTIEIVVEIEESKDSSKHESDEVKMVDAKNKASKEAKAADAAQGFIQLIASAVEVDEGRVRSIVKDEVKPIWDAIGQPKILVIDNTKKELGELPATRHPIAETLLQALSVKVIDGTALNVWVAGPAGSGKTFAVRQVAKALGLEYGFHGAMTMPHELIGFVDAGGTYHETVFVRLYRNGGVCLLDECDAGSSEALLTLNAALANGQMSLPTGEILDRHQDFRCVAAANTFGHGATAEYVGRAKIDAAFLDRFGVRLSWGYDEKLEREMCGNQEWAKFVQQARKNASQKGLKVMITPRASVAGAALVASGMSFKEVADITFLSGLTEDQRKEVMPPTQSGKSKVTTSPVDF